MAGRVMMADGKAFVLIVDNDPAIRFSLCQILRHTGHWVRTAEDGFVALQEINDGVPDVLVSDLNMPRMSGFELLSVVRRRFPSVYVIGMTGAFVDRLPPGIAADAFYRKASGITVLLDLIRDGLGMEIESVLSERRTTPIWVPAVPDTGARGSQVFLGCPECLRAFPTEAPVIGLPQKTSCAYCLAPINFAVVEQYA
jgi:CheY-like chemotaxis protein